MSENLELLSPAGDMECLKSAVDFGADAVYVGMKSLGMRASAKNFDGEGLSQGVAYAHEHGVKVYLTCNTLPHNDSFKTLPDYLREADNAGADALIVADLGVLEVVKETLPDMEVHMSTQVGIVNYRTARALYNMGAKRIVLARELPLEEIAEIRAQTPKDLEIEGFVHGAMCMSFSGRCLLSHYMTGRDANQGQCAQPCRWGYHLVEEKRPGEYYPIYEDESGSYILNAKDMCLLEHLDKLAKAGINSFKIEGRAKSSYYVSVVTNAYAAGLKACKEAINTGKDYRNLLPEWVLPEVDKVSHRGYTPGFYMGPQADSQYYKNAGYIREYDVVGLVTGWSEGILTIEQRNRFFKGDTLEIVKPGEAPVEFTVEELWDEKGTELEVANHPKAVVKLKAPYAPAPSIVRMRVDGK